MRQTILILVGTFILAVAAMQLEQRSYDKEHELESLQCAFAELENRAVEVLHLVEQQGVAVSELQELWQKEQIGCVIYENGRSVAWSTRSLPFSVAIGPRENVEDGLVRMRNGWYLCRTATQNGQLLAVFALLRTDYGFENRYVRNEWNRAMEVPSSHQIVSSDESDVALRFKDGSEAVHVKIAEGDAQQAQIAALLWLLALIGLFLVLWRTADALENRWGTVRVSIFFGLTLLLLRGLMLWTKWPASLYAHELFGPVQYASSWMLPSLGDLLLSLLCLFAILLRLQCATLPSVFPGWVSRWGLPILAHLTVWPVFLLLRTLVVDAAFPLDLNMPFSLTWYSIIGLVCSFLVLLLYYLTQRWILKPLHTGDADQWSWVLPFMVGWSINLLLADGRSQFLIVTLVGGLVTGFMILQMRWAERIQGFARVTPIVLVFSLFATVVLQTTLHQNEHERREALARRLDIQQDPVMEYLFAELEETLQQDRELRNALALLPEEGDRALARLHRRLNYDHWNRYRSIVHIYDPEGNVLLSDLPTTAPSLEEMERQFIASRPTLSEHLHYAGNWNSDGGYLARIVFSGRRSQPDLTLYIHLRMAGSEELLGFSDLFIDEGVSITRAIEGYSFARYQNEELRYQAGEFRYGLRSDIFESATGEFQCMVSGGADHLVYRPVEGTLMVVSRAERNWLAHLTIFSYLFLFYFGCAVLLSFFDGSLKAAFLARRSFRNRINLATAGLLTGSLIVIGLLTVYHVVTEHRAHNHTLITEKSRSVLLELEQKLHHRQRLDINDRGMLHPLLTRLSKVFFTDINVYGLDGRLLSSSRPRVFKEGLMAQIMDPVAYDEMRFNNPSSFMQTERIGRLSYQTAYVPFRNHRDETIAYLSIPYFARQYGLQQQIIALLAPLINIYVFLILLAVVVALVISNRITEPLRIVREGLRNLRLEGGNRTIEWDSPDEIGELVREYNRTLNELVRSAEMLARSERESAWREMAKQVAHEIKNPLTPMRLNVQMLERSYNDGAPDLGERIARTSRILIEQIDTLSNIASEFSRFAQMPKAILESVNLLDLLNDVAELHKGQGAEISVRCDLQGPCMVQADREQMLRAFTNLVRNAMQAIPEGREGRVELRLASLNERYVVAVKDNGTGIPEELRSDVFVPNFTTKSAGMGLGLAMVQRIIEGIGGSIRFETETGVGTTFFVEIPILRLEFNL